MHKDRLNSILAIFVKYKFLLTGAFFFIIIALYSDYSWYGRNQLNSKKDKLIEQKEAYIKKIQKDSTKLEQLKTNDANLEKFARENYLMSAKKEEIFIVP